MEFTERQAFVLEKALVYLLSNLDEYNDCMSECEEDENDNTYSRAFVTEQEIKEVICKIAKSNKE